MLINVGLLNNRQPNLLGRLLYEFSAGARENETVAHWFDPCINLDSEAQSSVKAHLAAEVQFQVMRYSACEVQSSEFLHLYIAVVHMDIRDPGIRTEGLKLEPEGLRSQRAAELRRYR